MGPALRLAFPLALAALIAAATVAFVALADVHPAHDAFAIALGVAGCVTVVALAAWARRPSPSAALARSALATIGGILALPAAVALLAGSTTFFASADRFLAGAAAAAWLAACIGTALGARGEAHAREAVAAGDDAWWAGRAFPAPVPVAAVAGLGAAALASAAYGEMTATYSGVTTDTAALLAATCVAAAALAGLAVGGALGARARRIRPHLVLAALSAALLVAAIAMERPRIIEMQHVHPVAVSAPAARSGERALLTYPIAPWSAPFLVMLASSAALAFAAGVARGARLGATRDERG